MVSLGIACMKFWRNKGKRKNKTPNRPAHNFRDSNYRIWMVIFLKILNNLKPRQTSSRVRSMDKRRDSKRRPDESRLNSAAQAFASVQNP